MSCENVVRASLPFPMSPWMTHFTQSLCNKGFSAAQIVTLFMEMFGREEQGGQEEERSAEALSNGLLKLESEKEVLLELLKEVAQKLKDQYGIEFGWVDMMRWLKEGNINLSDAWLTHLYNRFRQGFIRSKSDFISEATACLQAPAIRLPRDPSLT